MKGVFIGALLYADDITILSLRIGGLKKMLKICHIFAEKNSIIFIREKTVSILNLEAMLIEMKKHI